MISIHKALAGLDLITGYIAKKWVISIHKALAGLDIADLQAQIDVINFNPQGPRGPRPLGVTASCIFPDDFNPQGPRGPRRGKKEVTDL